MGRRRNELRNAAGLILKLRINCSRIRSEDQFLYANFRVPPLLANAPSLQLLWQRHWAQPEERFANRIQKSCSALVWLDRRRVPGLYAQ